MIRVCMGVRILEYNEIGVVVVGVDKYIGNFKVVYNENGRYLYILISYITEVEYHKL
jgi:hypothetical protein